MTEILQRFFDAYQRSLNSKNFNELGRNKNIGEERGLQFLNTFNVCTVSKRPLWERKKGKHILIYLINLFNGQTQFVNLAANSARFLNCV